MNKKNYQSNALPAHLKEGHLGVLGHGWYITYKWIFYIDKILCQLFHPVRTIRMKIDGLAWCAPLGYHDKNFQRRLNRFKKSLNKNRRFIWCKII